MPEEAAVDPHPSQAATCEAQTSAPSETTLAFLVVDALSANGRKFVCQEARPRSENTCSAAT